MEQKKRDDVVRSLIDEGKTAKEIAYELSVSRQRVYQLLKRLGLSVVRKPEKQRISKRYGLPMSVVRELIACGATRAYTYQRRNAFKRGIPWEISFADWWGVWAASGKWELRGRQKGGWVMGRPGDKGPYTVGNVVICNHSENAKVAQSHARRRIRVARVEVVRSKKRPYAVRRGADYFGAFPTMEQALAKKAEIDSQNSAYASYARRT